MAMLEGWVMVRDAHCATRTAEKVRRLVEVHGGQIETRPSDLRICGEESVVLTARWRAVQ